MKLEHYSALLDTGLTATAWQSELTEQLEAVFAHPSHGHFNKWLAAVDSLPKAISTDFDFTKDAAQVGHSDDLDPEQLADILNALKTLSPWRKGPFNYCGIAIDSEWQCQQKWSRFEKHLGDMHGKRVLDVGCGNGYYMLRMLGAGAEQVIGVDPGLVFLAQFQAIIQTLKQRPNTHLLPLPFEQLPAGLHNFDHVLSFGLLYHRRQPQEHLSQLHDRLQAGGTLYLETLILETEEHCELVPEDRYAGMRNVWSIASPSFIQHQLQSAGFEDVECLDQTTTSLDEQRASAWMTSYSLENFLDPNDHSKTIEGHPAPVRGLFRAVKAN